MKLGTMCGHVLVPWVMRSSRIGIVCLIFVIASSALHARAGNIFDDDWTPPKPVGPQHSPPAQHLTVTPTPATTTSIPAATLQTPSRRAIPEKSDQARSRGLLKEAFAGQLKDRSIAGRKKLAQALLDEVYKAADNPVDQYVLLGGAIEAAKGAAVLPFCFQAADIMASQYEVDGLSVKTEAALKMNLRGDSPAGAAENVKAAMELIDPLLAAEDFTAASRLLSSARPAATSDPAMASIVQKRIQIVETLRTAHDRFTQQLQKLKTAPDDPAANLAVGSYLCFSKGEWEKGLPMLAKGSDANIKQLADLDISRPTSAVDVMRLGDRWWEFGAKQPDAIRGEIDQRAASFYKVALESATGLRRTLLERRIADAAAAGAAATQPSAALLRGGSESVVNAMGMKFVRIKPGTFMMGSPTNEVGRHDDETLHHVKITIPYFIATTQVTQGQWKAIMGINRSRFKGDDLPVDRISWDDAMAFCDKLGGKEGKHYRLPTEAEWEYACRAGTQTPYGGDNNLDDMGWYIANSNISTHPGGQKKPNAWGLYDMHGNLWQWCSDGYGPYGGDAVDPIGARDATMRVLRGGAWFHGPNECRSASRDKNAQDKRNDRFGFRICMDF